MNLKSRFQRHDIPVLHWRSVSSGRVQNIQNVQEVADVIQAFSKIILLTRHEHAQVLSGLYYVHIHIHTHAYVHFVTIHFHANVVSISVGKDDPYFLLCDTIAIMI